VDGPSVKRLKDEQRLGLYRPDAKQSGNSTSIAKGASKGALTIKPAHMQEGLPHSMDKSAKMERSLRIHR
jgi:hypothetical protein